MNKAFTLIETLVVVLMTVILSAIMITYSHNGEKQIVLFRDQAKVVGVLNRAKFLSVQMFSKTDTDKPCAYGVYFENGGRSFLIFKDLKIDLNQPCSDSNHNNKYDSGELFEQFELDIRLQFQTTFSDVVFIPPDPRIIITPDAEGAMITIIDPLNLLNKKTVEVNNFGQITAQ